MRNGSYTPVAVSSLSLNGGGYISSIVRSKPNSLIAGIGTNDRLFLLDEESLKLSFSTPEKVHNGVTILKNATQNQLATAGRDFVVRLWDIRTKSNSSTFTLRMSKQDKGQATITDVKRAIFSLDCSKSSNLIAAGTELEDQDSQIFVWDTRKPAMPLVVYNEPHHDDVTDLKFHPTKSALLLSGSTDGVLNVIDTNVSAEEDAVVSTVNHGSSVFKTGWLTEKEVFALSHDEALAVHDINPDSAPEDEEGRKGNERGVDFGDLRKKLNVSYVADIVPLGNGVLIVAERTEQSTGRLPVPRLDAFTLKLDTTNVAQGESPTYNLSSFATHHLLGTHADEVTRSVVYDETSSVFWTAGEDGTVKSWTPAIEKDTAVEDESAEVKEQSHKVGRVRKDKKYSARPGPY